MKIAIYQGHVIDPSQSIDEVTNVFIENGKIFHIGETPSNFSPDKTIDATNHWVTPGFVDTTCRPHMQHPQGTTLYHEAKCALACGLTTLCIPPDGDAITESTANVLLPRLYPIGALTAKLNGESIADLAAQKEAGCIAFSQAQSSAKNLRILRHCYDFAASFSLPIIIQPCEPALARGGIAHEGNLASQLGLAGIPEIAETIAIAEHLLLIEDTGIRAHFTCLSTAKGIELIFEAKSKGLPITADVAMHSLHLNDESLSTFNSNYHVYPPIRSEHDRLGLIEGIKKKAIDAICSDHRPIDSIGKLAPFGDTIPGASSLDTLLPLGIKLIQQNAITRLDLVRLLSTQPASLLNLPVGTLMPGAMADLCIIDPNHSWQVSDETLKSKGKNSPFKHQTLSGRIVKTILNGQIVYENADS